MTDSSNAWGVFPHADVRVPTGRGYVVREMQNGFAVDQYNYGGIAPVASFSRRAKAAAEKAAEKLTQGEGANEAPAAPPAPPEPVVELVEAATTCQMIAESLLRWSNRSDDPAYKETVKLRAEELGRVVAKLKKVC